MFPPMGCGSCFLFIIIRYYFHEPPVGSLQRKGFLDRWREQAALGKLDHCVRHEPP